MTSKISNCSIICLNIPHGLQLGIDCFEYRVTDQFRGFAHVPVGVHVIHYSIAGSNTSGAESSVVFGGDLRRCLFLHLRSPGDVAVLAWDAQREDMHIVRECISEQQLLASGSVANIVDRDANIGNIEALAGMFERMVIENRELGTGLGPYPMDQYGQWCRLTDCITWSVVDRLQPVGRKILSSVESAPVDAEEESKILRQLREYEKSRGILRKQEEEEEENSIDQMTTAESRDVIIFFTHIPRKLIKKGATPEEITRINFDKSALLEQLLQEEFDGEEDSLIAEFQFAFICFYIGHNLQGFEQWKSIVHLLCNCDDAIQHHPQLFLRFVRTLHAQIDAVPDDFFAEDLHTDNFLNKCLASLFEIVISDSAEEDLVGRDIQHLRLAIKRLSQLVQQRFQWDFEQQEGDEYGPTIV